MAALLEVVLANLASMWVELCFFVFFALGFAFLRIDAFSRGASGQSHKQQKWADEQPAKAFDARLRKSIEAESSAGNAAAVLKAWRSGQAAAPTPPELLKAVVQAFVEREPDAAVAELLAHMQLHATALGNSRIACVVLDVVARAGRVQVMEEFWDAFQKDLRINPTYQMYEMLLGGYASVGDENKVTDVFERLHRNRLKVTARGYSLTIKGFLKNGMVDAVQKQLLAMDEQGIHIPSFAVTQFFRIACEANRTIEAFNAVEAHVVPPAEAIVLLVEDCSKRNDLDLARRVEKLARKTKQPLLCGAYDALLKLYTVAGDLYALELFEEMQVSGLRISEGLCVGLLSRCADCKFLRFAEAIVKFSRARKGMTIAVYSALMKVYAYCGMYDKACNLYDQIREDGLEPDAMMYGCLMKFSVECGRTKLSCELSERAPSLDIQNYMSLIRAAGRDRDVERAFTVLEKLRDSGVSLDIAAYNCVLDVCVSAGDMTRARELVNEMKTISSLDIITYNTLMKGYCSSCDLRGAKALLVEMEDAGHKPNDVTYNCLINACVTSGGGNFREAWDTIARMERAGIAVDHYTISIMMKALKKVKNPKDVSQALELLDRAGLDVCADEILLNTVLETCIRHRECRRLEGILESYMRSGLRPSVHTYGSLIKASSALKRLDQCWALWHEMEDQRGMEPNDIVLGCMLDALVCNSHIDEAVELFTKWKARVPGNTVIWSTLIKGFANTHQAERAMDAWHEMRAEGTKMNTVVYNAVIDAQARVGAMDALSELVETMAIDGCTPDTITYSTIVKGYCVKGDLDKAFEVFRGMQKNKMAGDSIIYNTILDGCTRHGRMDLADLLLEDMEKYNIVPSNFTLGILVKMYGRRRQLDKALEVVEKLPKRYNFSPNAQVRTCLMCTCINNNALDTAFEIFEDLKKHGQGADAKAYGALVSGCVRHGQLEKAVTLVDEAYGLNGQDRTAAAGRPERKRSGEPLLETEILEHLLRALAQKDLLESQGLPLLERLRAANIPVSGRLFASAMGGDSRGSGQTAASAKAPRPWDKDRRK